MLRTTRSRYPVFLALSFVRRFRHTRDLFLDHSLVQRLTNGAMLQSLDLSPSLTVLLRGPACLSGWIGQTWVIVHRFMRRKARATAVANVTRSAASLQLLVRYIPAPLRWSTQASARHVGPKGSRQKNQSSHAKVKVEDRRKLFFLRELIGCKLGKKISYSLDFVPSRTEMVAHLPPRWMWVAGAQ